jgi:ABC-type lipoprotein release transport system permease subunit
MLHDKFFVLWIAFSLLMGVLVWYVVGQIFDNRRHDLVQNCTENRGELVVNENGTLSCHYPAGTALESMIPIM